VAGDGSLCDKAIAEVTSAIRFHLETFGSEALPEDSQVLEAIITAATIPA
jgi:hypothetical protein